MELKSGRPRTEACTFLSEHVTGRSGLVQTCYERAIRLTIHLLGASNDDFGA